MKEQLDDQGYKARKGQIVDASFVDVPKQRNSRSENAEIKEGKIPQRFEENPNIKSQKDIDARWTKKNEETHFGYKNHVSVDNAHETCLVSFQTTDSRLREDLLSSQARLAEELGIDMGTNVEIKVM